jgi:uncharacterized protein YggE
MSKPIIPMDASGGRRAVVTRCGVVNRIPNGCSLSFYDGCQDGRMTETLITVQGTARERHAAERAVVQLSVAHDGPAREAVVRTVTATAESVRTGLEPLHAEGGPVASWTSDRIAVWSDRPWNDAGKQLPLVYHASVGFTATFTGFDELARWVEEVALLDGVSVGSISWELTDTTREELLERVRTRAVQDARAKALVYARAAGLTEVRATAIADPGLLGSPDQPTPGVPMARMAFAAKDATGGSLTFTPDEIEVAAAVDARFAAS